ncbi:unnamed protein product [Rotaria socialis]|uniref:RFX-type winged-helix domain-containing protein n=1 Tax=Rotaria socialis TaxID=392032 RepID=A0A817T7L4_9BILA|nr:unnamed protein product [Rotaria socialis]CAF3315041.1 unnamed protein product [Rotaria socialis]CAF3326848.1 unnamed protein product [Rotaria socialis]CAF3470642.1 unnamed protein product [Rotaria socialis]CAF3724151.1 unnamed protein product [Rotaria socialis]
MSSSTTLPIRNESRLNGQQGQYLVATTNQTGGETNGNQTTGRVIIAKAHPPNQNSQINQNSNNISGPVQFQFNSSDGTLYTGTNSFFQPQSSNASSDSFSHHILSCTGGYFVPSLESGSQPLTHTTRASPATVQWLVDNFEPAEGCSLRRSTLYSFYLQHCSEQKLEAVNPASFGKLIRSVFLGLRTRRLGTRGNSKYHYYGIRVKQNSSLNAFSDEHGGLTFRGNNAFANFKNRRWSTSNDGSSPENKPNINDQSYSSQSESTLSQTDTKQFLHENNSFIINENIQIDTNVQLPEGILQDDIKRFENIYKDHCLKLFDVITTLDFGSVEQIWFNFWSQTGREETIPMALFHSICSLYNVQEFIRNSDYQLYQQLVDRLIVDILSPMPTSATQSIRTFGKSVDGWLRTALGHLPERLKTIKLTIINAFAMTLRRYTSLNHLAQAARAVLLNATQVNQMLADLNKVDFHNVQEQAWWVCECDDNLVSRIEREFKNHLSSQSTLEDWSQWLDSLLNDLLKPYSNFSAEKYTKQAKQILLNWSFYCSMVIRDLTLRSAASFGSFHLIRLLYDEYLFYLIEHKIALHTQKTPIAIMAELTLQNKLSIYDGINSSNGLASSISIERRNIQPKISLVVKKDTLSPAQILTLSGSTVQLPIINKLVSAAKLASQPTLTTTTATMNSIQQNEKDNNNCDSVKRLKTTDELVAV